MDKGTFDLYHTNLETTNYGKVFQKIISKDGFSANIIENYNNEILNNIPKFIEETNIKTSTGTIYFKNVRFFKPTTTILGKTENLTPKMSREKLIQYFGKIKVDIVHKLDPQPIQFINGAPVYPNSPKEETDEVKDFEIGSIPVMLGSEICHLHNKTAEEKIKMGECFNDPLGYFIIRSERVIINQENLRYSTFLIYTKTKDSKPSVQGVITCPTVSGTKITSIVIGKYNTLSVMLAHLTKYKEPLNIFAIYRLLGMKMNDAVKQILSFIDEKDRIKAKYSLESTIAQYKNILTEDDDYDTLVSRIIEIRKSKKFNRNKAEDIISDVYGDLLSNIDGNENKLLHLSMYTARMVEYMIDARKLNDRDSFGNKRFATPGRSLFFLFKGIWAELIKDISYKIDSNIKTARQVANLVKVNEIRNQMSSAFGPNAWGVKKSYRKENITESLKRDTPLAVFSQIGRINTPASKQSKNAAVRMPHATQLGYCCLWETPEGEGCGLVKNLASTCYVSLERDPKPIYDIINLIKNDSNYSVYLKEDRDKGYTPLLVNGIIKGWCYPEAAVIIFKNYKSQGYIPKDICIFFNRKDKCVEIFTDGGRPTRPLFVVDENSELIIDKLNMWNSSIDELVSNNCIEYIDAREQEWIYLAETIEKVYQRKELLKLIKQDSSNEEYKNLLAETLQYSHCEIDPTAAFSISTNLVPQAHRTAGPRVSYQSSMGRQALTQYHSNEHLRFDTSYKMVYYPTKSLFQNDVQETSGLNAMSNGQILQIAIMAHPDNAEDGIVLKQETVEYGKKFNMCKKFTFTSVIKNVKHKYSEKFAKPPVKSSEPDGRYDAIDEKGIPKLDAYIRPFDCIIGKIREFNEPTGNYNVGDIENISEFAGVGEEGYIDRVLITLTGDQEKMIKVKVRQNRKYIPGDKLACMTSDHTVLTRNRGWVNIDKISLDDEVATLNHKNKMEYQKPTALHSYNCKGENMYLIENDHISMNITTNHRLYHSMDGEKWYLKEAKDLRHYDYFYLMTDKGPIKVMNKDFKDTKCKNFVYCISVPNEVFMIHHNGKTHYTGNSRYSQKGTVSRIVPARLLPRVASGPLKGMVPDILINPHSQPSRMTMNNIIEIIMNKASCISGKYYNATTFRNFEKEIEEAQKTLTDYGLDPMGNDFFEFPNGRQLKTKCYFGPCFYQALRHHVTDKIQMRARKGIKPNTRQPVSGRAHEGGLKVGEMERDALISHGSSGLLRERLCLVSDVYKLPICGNCGTIAITKNIDIPNPNICMLCGPKAHIGIIEIPYVVKLLLFYLQAAGIMLTFKTSEVISKSGRMEEKFLD